MMVSMFVQRALSVGGVDVYEGRLCDEVLSVGECCDIERLVCGDLREAVRSGDDQVDCVKQTGGVQLLHQRRHLHSTVSRAGKETRWSLTNSSTFLVAASAWLDCGPKVRIVLAGCSQ